MDIVGCSKRSLCPENDDDVERIGRLDASS